MTPRERFLSVVAFEPVDRTMLWEIGYWTDAVRRWHREGFPHRHVVPAAIPGGRSMMGSMNLRRPYGTSVPCPEDDESRLAACAEEIHDYFGLDQGMVHIPLEYWIYPRYEEEILEDHGDWVVWRDSGGIVKRDRVDRKSIPRWIGAPVSNRNDWEQVKAERLQPDLGERVPDDWPQQLEAYRQRDYVLAVGGHPAGFYGGARSLLGPERVLMAFYDDPQFLREIMDYLADFWVSLYDQALDHVDVDVCFMWEDMCYRNAPLISPQLFREFMLPNYKKVTACLRDHGVSAIMVDTDGDARELIPLFVEGGVTIMYPLEPPAGMDVVELREAYPRLGLMGGMDKRVLARGRAAIDEELERKIPLALQRGGYIPYLDHQAPPDIPWENFRYYRQKLSGMVMGEGK